MLLSQPRDQSYDVQSALSETSRFDPTSNSKVEHNIHGDHHNFLGSRGRWRHVLSCLMVFIQTLAELGASQNCLYYSREYKTYSFLPPPKRVQKIYGVIPIVCIVEIHEIVHVPYILGPSCIFHDSFTHNQFLD